VCNSLSSAPLYRQRFASFPSGSIADGYDVVVCRRCGMCFASGLPSEGRFAEYYRESSKYDLAAGEVQLSPEDRRRFSDQAQFVGDHASDRTAPLLDVGTATGGFLEALRREGFERLYGVDPSPDAVSVARGVRGLDVRVGGLAAAGQCSVPFGLVSYIAVLEHLVDPRAEVRAVGRLLRSDGLMFVSVPDAGSFRHHAAAPFQEFSVEHVNFFTSGSLGNLMASEGYSLVAERSVVQPLGTDHNGPVLEAIFRRGSSSRPPQRDRSGADAIRDYVAASEAAERLVIDRIAGLASACSPIYVWGTGTHTLHLLEVSRLGDCRIEAFIDSNPHYAGGTLAGRRVLPPTSIDAVDAPILVSAARARFGSAVPLILLYPEKE
jgi:SAM-dependent methyltransferase